VQLWNFTVRIAITLLSLWVHSANAQERQSDQLDYKMVELAGVRAVNCGRVPLHGDTKAANDCALRALSGKRPFRVRYDLQGIDSEVAYALVRTPGGRLNEIDFDSDISGGRFPQGAPRITVKPCPQPTNVRLSDKLGLRGKLPTCFPVHEK